MTTQTALLPTFESYGNYASSNYGAHTLVFSDGRGRYYFSYKTLVAFQRWGSSPVVHENVWGVTTGKHLNWIDGGTNAAKRERLSSDDFERAYTEAFA